MYFCSKIIICFILLNAISVSESAYDNSFWFRSNQIKYDSGLNWENLSSISPYFLEVIHNKNIYKKRYQIFGQKENLVCNGPLYFFSKNKFYGYFEPKIFFSYEKYIDDRSIDSFFEIVSSGIGYMNEWVTVQITKGQERLGSR